MDALVFKNGKEDLFTTSEVIAKFAGVQHHIRMFPLRILERLRMLYRHLQ